MRFRNGARFWARRAAVLALSLSVLWTVFSVFQYALNDPSPTAGGTPVITDGPVGIGELNITVGVPEAAPVVSDAPDTVDEILARVNKIPTRPMRG